MISFSIRTIYHDNRIAYNNNNNNKILNGICWNSIFGSKGWIVVKIIYKTRKHLANITIIIKTNTFIHNKDNRTQIYIYSDH